MIKEGTLLIGNNGMIVSTLRDINNGQSTFAGAVIHPSQNKKDHRQRGYTSDSWVRDFFKIYEEAPCTPFLDAIDLLEAKLKEHGTN